MLAHERLTIAKFIGKDDRLLVLLQDLAIVAVDGVHRLGEKSEFHDWYP